MTSLPDWLVERAALDEVPSASRDRIDRADPRELAERVAALRDDNASELAAHPAGPAVAQIEARIRRRASRPGRRWLAMLGVAASTTGIILVVTRLASNHAEPAAAPTRNDEEITRIKGATRLLVFRQVGDQAERLDNDAIVRRGDLLQLRYKAGGQRHGLIASIDGAGAVTLHFPLSEDAPTAVAADSATLPHAYALDDAPRFERFFFITANEPIDVQQGLAALRALAQRPDSATADLDLPAGLHQLSLRLRKPSSNHESP